MNIIFDCIAIFFYYTHTSFSFIDLILFFNGYRNSRRTHALQGLAVVSSRGHNETPTCQRSPGHCRGIITWAQ